MNERKIHRVAEFLADDIESEVGPKVGPSQPVTVANELLGSSDAKTKRRLEYLRKEIEAGRISYGEIQELQSLVRYIDPSDVLLLEWAGVKEGDLIKKLREKHKHGNTNRESVANELLLIAEDLVAMDFSTQKQMDDYLKEHPDADKSKHKVVQHDSKKPETNPHNLMKQRENEKAMGDIGKHFKKNPKDLTVDEITEYNQKKGK